MALRIGAWRKTTLNDYPGLVASTIFLQGCNFHCGYCHNPDLVDAGGESDLVDEEGVLHFLHRRKGLVDGLCVSGGEPLVQKELPLFLQKIRSETGLEIKLDTNGSFPERLSRLLEKGLLDYVALDVKTCPELYHQATGWTGDPQLILESAERLRSSGVEFELRTTLVPGLSGPEQVEKICHWMDGGNRYILQQFRPSQTLDPTWAQKSPYSPEIIEKMAESCRRYFKHVAVRGC